MTSTIKMPETDDLIEADEDLDEGEESVEDFGDEGAEDERQYSQSDGEPLWRKAKSFDRICELTALFIEGKLPFFPLYGGDEDEDEGTSIDEETNPIAPYLARFNRCGFWTTCSQPGGMAPDWRQRAFVSGYAPESVALRLAETCLFSDLIVMAYAPGDGPGYQVPVTVEEFQPSTWAGASGLDQLADDYEGYCSPEVVKEMKSLWSVVVIDPCWGRETYLWETLIRQIGFSAEPYWGLETSFVN